MKKEYRKPQTEAIEIKTVGMIAGSATTTTSFDDWGDGGVINDDDD